MKHRHQIGRQWLNSSPSSLLITCIEGHGCRIGQQVEARRGQRCQFQGAEAGTQRRGVQHHAGLSAQLPTNRTSPGRFHHAGNLSISQFSPFSLNSCSFDVPPLQVDQPIVSGPPVPDQPAGELFDRPQVVVDRLLRHPVLLPISQISLHAECGDVADEAEFASVDDRPATGLDWLAMTLNSSSGPQGSDEVGEMLIQRPASMLMEWIAALNLPDAFGEHRLRGLFVRAEFFGSQDAVRVPEFPPPGLGLCLDSLSSRRVF